MNYLFDYLLSLPYLTETCSLVMAFSLSALLCLDLDRSKTVIPGMERHLSLEHKWHQTVKEPLRLVTLFFSPANDQYMVLSLWLCPKTMKCLVDTKPFSYVKTFLLFQ